MSCLCVRPISLDKLPASRNDEWQTRAVAAEISHTVRSGQKIPSNAGGWLINLTSGGIPGESVSFINDISLSSVRHLLSSQKGNYPFRPGNNIQSCLGSRARRGAKRREEREVQTGILPPV